MQFVAHGTTSAGRRTDEKEQLSHDSKRDSSSEGVPDGTFTDESIGVTYRGQERGRPVEIYAAAFPDMHRELYRLYVVGDTVVVELALQGTHKGPLELPTGIVPPTGKRMDAPCCDVFQLRNGKIQSFNCYPSGTVILAQLGVMPGTGHEVA